MKICPACSREYPSERSHCERDGVMLVALTTGAGARAEDLIGKIVDGRYQVEAIIGKGGMGTVYSCRHVVVGKPFAMKVLRQGVEQTGDVLQRFIREAQTANSVRSRHIVEMTDFGQLQSGQFYVTMELLEGMDLGKALKSGLSREQLLHVFIQCADVLELTHQRGIVHRDLKPDNIFLVNEEGDPLFAKLLDFGIAKALHAGPSGLTETGVVLGTPYYMSPEQARGEEVDHRTDIYSLGVIMYRAFTGKLPFVADSAVGVLTRHLTEAPAPPSRVSGVEPGIERVILCCLEKRRDGRFPSMRALADALRALRAAGRPASLLGLGPASIPGSSGAYTAAQPSVHNAGAPTASGPYAAVPQAASGAYPAGTPGVSGAYAAPAPTASGAYPAGPPGVSGAYAAPAPTASGSYVAAGTGPQHPMIPAGSGAHAAAPHGATGPYGAARTGGHAPVPPASGVYAAGAMGVHNGPPSIGGAPAAQMGGPPSMGSPPSMSGPAQVGGPPSMSGPASMGNPAAEWTSHGLATSQGLRIPAQKPKWPLLVGALAMLAIGGGIAVTLGALGRSGDPAAAGPGATAAPSSGGSTAAASTSSGAEAPAASGAPTSAPAPTDTPSAAPSSPPSAAASPTGAATPHAAGPGPKATPKASASAGPKPPTTTKRPPEIRSPFD